MFIWVVYCAVPRIKNIKLIFFYTIWYITETNEVKQIWSYAEIDLIVQAFGLEMVSINV